ncbi:hypothetical protein ACJIZ3_017887 [Penstemon smallii]|uniref:Copper transport protein n=1 Tax=Penstemon smallii TaxID=265156 RepID=A0ABD3SWT8_9LAMI
MSTFIFGKGKGDDLCLYLVDLLIVFLLTLLVEWLSHTRFFSDDSKENKVRTGLIRTGLHTIRITMSYLVMLSIMSFNVGILFAAIAGNGLGFFIFGSGVLDKKEIVVLYHKPSDLPPLIC